MKTMCRLAIVFAFVLGFGALNFTSLVQDWDIPFVGVADVYAGADCRWGITICNGQVVATCIRPNGWIPGCFPNNCLTCSS